MLILLVLEVVLHVPVELTVTGRNFLRLTILYLTAALPFFLTGLLFSVVFARETWRVSRLYGADLCGGALACLAVVPLLNWIGGPNTILAAAVVMAIAAARLGFFPGSAQCCIWFDFLFYLPNRRESHRPVHRRSVCQRHVSRSGMG